MPTSARRPSDRCPAGRPVAATGDGRPRAGNCLIRAIPAEGDGAGYGAQRRKRRLAGVDRIVGGVQCVHGRRGRRRAPRHADGRARAVGWCQTAGGLALRRIADRSSDPVACHHVDDDDGQAASVHYMHAWRHGCARPLRVRVTVLGLFACLNYGGIWMVWRNVG